MYGVGCSVHFRELRAGACRVDCLRDAWLGSAVSAIGPVLPYGTYEVPAVSGGAVRAGDPPLLSS